MSHQITHSYLRDANLLHKTFAYQQPSDPGAVGAGVWWLNTTLVESAAGSGDFGYKMAYRNDTNDDWVVL